MIAIINFIQLTAVLHVHMVLVWLMIHVAAQMAIQEIFALSKVARFVLLFIYTYHTVFCPY